MQNIYEDLEMAKKINTKFAFIDLFSGIGGFRLALESFKGRCVFSSEWDKFAALTYKENFGEDPAGDITKINSKDIPKHDVLCGGFPCQAFSISGKQNGFNDTRGTLFFEIARIVEFHNPKVLFLENVKNFARHDNSKTLATVLRTLKELGRYGYDPFYQIINSSRFGVPQSRERIYIVCFRKDLHVQKFEFPKPIDQPVKLKDIIEPEHITKDFVLRRNDIKITHEIQKYRDIFGNYPLRPLRIGSVNKGGQGERIYSELGHAITLSAYGGGAAGKTGAYLINGRVRQLTPRECLRVLGFPERFKFPEHVTTHQAYKQAGNSVVVPVVKAIFEEVVKKGVLWLPTKGEKQLNEDLQSKSYSYV